MSRPKLTPEFELSMMLVLASGGHHGQFDKAGLPYILHPIAVMHILNTDDLQLKTIAIGHDLIEDTTVTISELYNLGFSDRVIAGVLAMTKIDDESYEDYKARIKANPDAIKVKMADLTHNSQLHRMKGITEKDIKRTVKYMNFYNELKELT